MSKIILHHMNQLYSILVDTYALKHPNREAHFFANFLFRNILKKYTSRDFYLGSHSLECMYEMFLDNTYRRFSGTEELLKGIKNCV